MNSNINQIVRYMVNSLKNYMIDRLYGIVYNRIDYMI